MLAMELMLATSASMNSNNSWTQLGSDIDGEAAGDQFGFL